MVAIARVANCVGRLIFDTKFQKVLSNSIKASGRLSKIKGNGRFTKFGKQIADSFIKAEKKTAGNSFFKDMKKLITDYPADLKNAWKGASGLKEKAKAIWDVSKSRGPLLGYGLLVGFEVPNILKATTEDGVVTGAVETTKSTARLAGASLGAAIGTALVPGIGSILGWIGGEYLTSKIVGKSYTDKQLAQEEKMKELFKTNNPMQNLDMQQLMEGLNNPNFTDQLNYAQTNQFAPSQFMQNSNISQSQLAQMYNALYGNNKLDLSV